MLFSRFVHAHTHTVPLTPYFFPSLELEPPFRAPPPSLIFNPPTHSLQQPGSAAWRGVARRSVVPASATPVPCRGDGPKDAGEIGP